MLAKNFSSVSAIYDRVSVTRAYDLLMRLPVAGWHLWISYKVAIGVIQAINDPHPVYPALLIAARVAKLVFFISFAVLSLVRMSPVLRGSGIRGRIVALVGMIGFSLVVFLPARPLSPAILGVSIGLIAVGCAVSAYTVWHLGRSLSIMPEARQLVTSGPYRIVRHPLYLCEFIAMTGVALQYLSWTAGFLLLTQAGLQLLRMLNEERVLRRAFADYDCYAARTARLIPGIY